MSWFKITFLLMHEHGWKLEEIEGMYPFELDVYTSMLAEYLEMKKNAREQAEQAAGMR
jgi:hypothetical protein